MISRRGLLVAGTAVAAGAVAASCSSANGTKQGLRLPSGLPRGWVATWGAPSGGPEPLTDEGLPRKSIRNVLHTSIGGSAARVRLSNMYGTVPVRFDHVTLALAMESTSPAARPGTMRDVKFQGRADVVVQPGTEVWSDPVKLELPEDSDILVTTYSRDKSGPVSYHPMAVQQNFMADGEDVAADESPDRYVLENTFWRYVTEIAVLAPESPGTVVTFGGSTTDGSGSTMSGNGRWCNFLGRRLLTLPPNRQLGVFNAGVSANRMLMDSNRWGHMGAGKVAFHRLDTDVLNRAAVRTLIIAHGINDLWQPPLVPQTTSRLVAELQKIVSRCHTHGVRVVGTTLTPFKGWVGHNPDVEARRQEINRFIRNSELFDAVTDFVPAVADPRDPERIRPEFDFGDHLHCNDDGYRAMAEAIDLTAL